MVNAIPKKQKFWENKTFIIIMFVTLHRAIVITLPLSLCFVPIRPSSSLSPVLPPPILPSLSKA